MRRFALRLMNALRPGRRERELAREVTARRAARVEPIVALRYE